MAKLTSLALLASASLGAAQTYQPDFLPGQYFDLRVEVHAPLNGSEAFNNGVPDEAFTTTIRKVGEEVARPITEFFPTEEPKLETWQFGWYEDRFARAAESKSIVNVASKIYRRIHIKDPGEYEVTLTYYNGETTVANWVVRPIYSDRKAKNVILFIGDGMTTSMASFSITAARMLAHKSVNGKYQSHMAMDSFPVLGHQMTHSIDTTMTDSANSASALYSGHKGSARSMGVYSDSSPDQFDDPKVETIVELVTRILGMHWGAATTANLNDATPAALVSHTRSRSNYGPIIDQILNGITNYTWNEYVGPEVFLGGGAEAFLPGDISYLGQDYYSEFAKKGYGISWNKSSLMDMDSTSRALGVFSTGSLPVWLDRNIYTENLAKMKNHPSGEAVPALDVPGLTEIASKAIEITHARSRENGEDKGFFLMIEAASIDKQMHRLDYDRGLGDLLELDDTISKTIEQLKEMGILDETQIIVTADHGHGFDVFGSADTKYLAAAQGDRQKRNAIGVYGQSGESQYTKPVPGISYGTGPNFPVNWEPRYAMAAGMAASPDHREDYRVHKDGPRSPIVRTFDEDGKKQVYANPKDSINGMLINGTLSTVIANSAHSMTDVPVFARGPCQNEFGGVYNNVDVFYKIAKCLGLGTKRTDDVQEDSQDATGRAADRF
ncbi:Alkaline phosphatase [Ceratocystis platani]|uniref:alkaline phosphatase n=1 Tax=Ceratocystis fimbriata f. sp. platani TaxID=88771 RepID=A0A0F8B1R4_CERFI|nr:Alkaline phosphatase [Ceratocystis platani]